jgi:zinc transport system substrate-binding protein
VGVVRQVDWLARLVLAGFLVTASAGPVVAGAKVVVSIKPVHSLVAGVMAGIGAPHLIVEGSASPHAYAMKPSDARALQEADVVFWVGPLLETFLAKALVQLPETTRVVELMSREGVVRHAVRTGTDWSNGHNGDHEHRHEAVDPHIWLDVENAKAIIAMAASELAEADPANTARYRANAVAVRERLAVLEDEIAAQLRPVQDRPFLVFHDAFQYFEKRFGLNAVGAVSLGGGRAPGARHVRALRQRIEKQGIVCLFTEPQFEPRIARVIAEGTGVRTAVLDPVGAGLETGMALYFKLMRRNATALAECLGGGG